MYTILTLDLDKNWILNSENWVPINNLVPSGPTVLCGQSLHISKDLMTRTSYVRGLTDQQFKTEEFE